MSAPDLATFLADDAPEGAPGPDTPDEERGRFRVENDAAACWALKKAALAEEELARIAALAKAEHERIDAWVRDASAGPEHDRQFFAGLLREYHEALLTGDIDRLMAEGKSYREAWEATKRKTYRLPAGDLVARKGGTGYDTEDAEAFDRWVREDPEGRLRFAKVSPVKAALKDATKHTEAGTLVLEGGEYVPGVRWYEDPPSFAAKPAPLPERE